jgi:hypothetical protein
MLTINYGGLGEMVNEENYQKLVEFIKAKALLEKSQEDLEETISEETYFNMMPIGNEDDAVNFGREIEESDVALDARKLLREIGILE